MGQLGGAGLPARDREAERKGSLASGEVASVMGEVASTDIEMSDTCCESCRQNWTVHFCHKVNVNLRQPPAAHTCRGVNLINPIPSTVLPSDPAAAL